MGPDNSSTLTIDEKLETNGSNWPTWKVQVIESLRAKKGVMRHLKGTARKPQPLTTITGTKEQPAVLTEDDMEKLEKLEEQWDEYHCCH